MRLRASLSYRRYPRCFKAASASRAAEAGIGGLFLGSRFQPRLLRGRERIRLRLLANGLVPGVLAERKQRLLLRSFRRVAAGQQQCRADRAGGDQACQTTSEGIGVRAHDVLTVISTALSRWESLAACSSSIRSRSSACWAPRCSRPTISPRQPCKRRSNESTRIDRRYCSRAT